MGGNSTDKIVKKEVEGDRLDVLEVECEKLLALLKDRQPGLSTWNSFFDNRLRSLQAAIDVLRQRRHS